MNLPAFVWLIGILFLAAPLVYYAGRIPRPALAHPLAVASLLAAWGPLVVWLNQAWAEIAPAYTIGTVILRSDGLSLLLAVTTLALGTLVAIYSGPFIKGNPNEGAYYALLLILIAVIIGLGLATDLFNLWVWFEAMTITSYFLVGFHHDQNGAVEATVKYLVQSTIGSVFILLGIAVVLLHTGALGYNALGAPGLPLQAAGLLFFVGFGVKAAIVPLHTWLPDAHSQAPSGISALLSGVVIEAGLLALVRSLSPLFTLSDSWGHLLAVSGAVNLLIGNLLALRQTQIKRLLAYSSLSQVGYLLLGFGIAALARQSLAAQGAFQHFINHGLMKALAFLAAGALLSTLPATPGHHPALTLHDLSGTARRYPLVALTLGIAVLGLGGLPPLAGFMSKWQILVGGLGANSVFIGGLILFAALNSVLSLAYYVPLVGVLYRNQPSLAIAQGSNISLTAMLPLAVLAAGIVLLGLWPTAFAWLTDSASLAILNH